MPKFWTDFIDSEKENYSSTYTVTRRTLTDAKLALKYKLLQASTFQEQMEVQKRIDANSYKTTDLDNDRMHLYANALALTPPSADTFAAIKNMADKADKLIANAQMLDAVVNLADQALQLYLNATKGG